MKYRQLGLCSQTQSNNQGPRAESCTLSLSRSERSQPSSQPSHTDVLPRHPLYSKQNDKLTSEAMHPFSGCSHCCWCYNSCKLAVATIIYWFLFVIEEVIKNVKHIEMTLREQCVLQLSCSDITFVARVRNNMHLLNFKTRKALCPDACP